MNLNAIPTAATPLRPQASAAPRVDTGRVGYPLRSPAPAPAQLPIPAQGTISTAPTTVSGAALPAEPPPGTDPELWSVLSADERVFFAKVGAMGPLTYGRMLSAQGPNAPALRGGRLDVRG